MTPEEYTDQRELLLKQRDRCAEEAINNNVEFLRLQAKIEKLDSTFENGFYRRDIGRPEQKLQQYGVV